MCDAMISLQETEVKRILNFFEESGRMGAGKGKAGSPSQLRLRSAAPPKGEPLAKTETLRGLPKPLTLGEVALR